MADATLKERCGTSGKYWNAEWMSEAGSRAGCLLLSSQTPPRGLEIQVNLSKLSFHFHFPNLCTWRSGFWTVRGAETEASPWWDGEKSPLSWKFYWPLAKFKRAETKWAINVWHWCQTTESSRSPRKRPMRSLPHQIQREKLCSCLFLRFWVCIYFLIPLPGWLHFAYFISPRLRSRLNVEKKIRTQLCQQQRQTFAE